MGLTQSAVSRLVRQLGDGSGFGIFDCRQGHPTPEGQRFYAEVEKILGRLGQPFMAKTSRPSSRAGSRRAMISAWSPCRSRSASCPFSCPSPSG